MSWGCFIANRGLIHCNHQPYNDAVREFLEIVLDSRLHNAWRDLHAFACISNLAHQTTSKLSPRIYNEIMISLLYRLTHLSSEDDPLQECIRVGLIMYCSAIFLQRSFYEQPYDHLYNTYSESLSRLYGSNSLILPEPIDLWLTMLLHLAARHNSSTMAWRRDWLDKALLRTRCDSWSQAREVLRAVVWVDFIHDCSGEQVYESVILRPREAT